MGSKKYYQSKMAANGQLVLPKELREALGLNGGDILTIQAEDRGGGILEVTIQQQKTDYRAVIGLLNSAEGKEATWNDDLKRLDEEEMK